MYFYIGSIIFLIIFYLLCMCMFLSMFHSYTCIILLCIFIYMTFYIFYIFSILYVFIYSYIYNTYFLSYTFFEVSHHPTTSTPFFILCMIDKHNHRTKLFCIILFLCFYVFTFFCLLFVLYCIFHTFIISHGYVFISFYLFDSFFDFLAQIIAIFHYMLVFLIYIILHA